MAIQQTKRQSDLEKRLKLLRHQVYGKEENKQSSAYSLPSTKIEVAGSQKEISMSDIAYLNQDLFKILILSSLAIGTQIVLFFLMQNHILNFKF